MTTHISDLIKQLKDEGYQLTTAAALLNKKATAGDSNTDSSAQKISTKVRITNEKGLVKYVIFTNRYEKYEPFGLVTFAPKWDWRQ